jgi:hypothetical protein
MWTKKNIVNGLWLLTALVLAVGPLWLEMTSWSQVFSFSGVISTAIVVAGVIRAWLTDYFTIEPPQGGGGKS